MCFSATASFTSAAFLGAVGLLTVMNVRSKKSLPLAIMPLLFSIHQLFEGIIWLIQDRSDLVHLQYLFALSFLIIAFVVWPIWIPLSIYLLETEKARKTWLLVALGVGLVSVTISIVNFARFGFDFNITCNHISYKITPSQDYCNSLSFRFNNLLYFIYLFSVCAPGFISRFRYMWTFGLALLAGFIVSKIFYYFALVSIWCFFGALASVTIYFILRKNQRRIS